MIRSVYIWSLTIDPVVGKPRNAALSLNEVGCLKPIWDEFTKGGFLTSGSGSEKLGVQNSREWTLPLLMIDRTQDWTPASKSGLSNWVE
jgi:hypothetical protein